MMRGGVCRAMLCRACRGCRDSSMTYPGLTAGGTGVARLRRLRLLCFGGGSVSRVWSI